MADVLNERQRSYCMSQIGGKNTRPEQAVRKLLFARGFRYRLHDPKLPGRPDIILPKYRAAIFVHGCFWHGHGCDLFRWPATNRAFWKTKLSRNRNHDNECSEALLDQGWRVLTVWECAFKGPGRLDAEAAGEAIQAWLCSDARIGSIEGSVASGEASAKNPPMQRPPAHENQHVLPRSASVGTTARWPNK